LLEVEAAVFLVVLTLVVVEEAQEVFELLQVFL
jgi:hypothetical protein